jgi:hypothetical protein
MKIGLITPDAGDACSTYRGAGPYRKLPFELNVYDGKKGFYLWEAITNNDVIVLQRPHTKQTVNIAMTIKAFNKPLIVDWDDDLSNVPPWNPFRKHFEECLPVLESCAKLADVVTVTTLALERKAASWGANRVEIVPNAIDDSIVQSFAQKPPRNKIVAWRGSDTHSADLEASKPKILELVNQGYDAMFFGAVPTWAYEIAGRYKHIEVGDYCVYLANIFRAAPEYFVYCLAEHPFNLSKSDVAAQEAYLVGAKLLHNNVGAYENLPETSEPRLLSTTNAQRIDIIKSLV